MILRIWIKNSILIIVLFLSFKVFAQDEILLINGKLLKHKVLYADNQFVSIEKPNKFLFLKTDGTKVKKMPATSVFSIKYNNFDNETIMYKADSVSGLILNIDNMHSFVYGEKWGRENFKAPWASVFGFIAGAAGGYYQFWGVPVPVVASIVIGIIPPKSKYINSFPVKYTGDHYFKAGFNDFVKKKKTGNAIIGGFAGFLTMTVITSYLSNQNW